MHTHMATSNQPCQLRPPPALLCRVKRDVTSLSLYGWVIWAIPAVDWLRRYRIREFLLVSGASMAGAGVWGQEVLVPSATPSWPCFPEGLKRAPGSARGPENRRLDARPRCPTHTSPLISVRVHGAAPSHEQTRQPLPPRQLDILAGLTVGAMVIPQGMSYANLAGLPSVYGLYGAFVPCLAYSLLGSSRQLAVGPVAVTSTLLGNGLDDMFGLSDDPNNPADPAHQAMINQAAVQVAFLAGVMYTGVALLRLGWVIRFLSHSVISGFMSGAAITIALGQVKYILGLKIGRGTTLQDLLQMIFSSLDQFSWREFVMGYFFMGLLYLFRWTGNSFRCGPGCSVHGLRGMFAGGLPTLSWPPFFPVLAAIPCAPADPCRRPPTPQAAEFLPVPGPHHGGGAVHCGDEHL